MRIWLVLLSFLVCVSAEDRWRSSAIGLVERVERLAAAGEVTAAQVVLDALLARPADERAGLADRARLALARAYLGSNAADQAQQIIDQTTWADKDPKVAAELVSVGLAVHWRGLSDRDGVLRSGMVRWWETADGGPDERESPWSQRAIHATALAQLLAGGVRQVRTERAKITLPAADTWLALGDWAHGRGALPNLERAGPDLLLATLRLHREEHDIEAAAALAERLWVGNHVEGSAAFALLRTWQLERRRVQGVLRFWAYPTIEARLDGLAARFPEAEASAQAAASVVDLSAAGLASAMVQAVTVPLSVTEDEVEIDIEPMPAAPNIPEGFAICFEHLGLSLTPQPATVAVGDGLRLHVDSRYLGDHAVAVWHLEDAAAATAFARDPQRGKLGEQPVVQVTWRPGDSELTIPAQREGCYVATVTARGAPVVAAASFSIVGPALYLSAARDEVVVWVVNRRTGLAAAEEPVQVTIERQLTPEAAAGAAWKEASDTWRSAFRITWFGETLPPIPPELTADAEAGSAAAQAALVLHPRHANAAVQSDVNGLARWTLPESFRDAAYTARAKIDRPSVAIEANAAYLHDAVWAPRTLAWPDRPLVRPGETLAWRALLRRSDGDRWELPEGQVTATLTLAGVTLVTQKMTPGIDGSLNGSLVIPPGATTGDWITLALTPGGSHALARVEASGLPAFDLRCNTPDSVRAGDQALVNVQLRDQHGQPMAGAQVVLVVSMVGHGSEGMTRETVTTGADGCARSLVSTNANAFVTYRVTAEYLEAKDIAASATWTTRAFPFVLDLDARERSVDVGGRLRLGMRLPESETMNVHWLAGEIPQGESTMVVGGGDVWRWLDLAVPHRDGQPLPTALEFSATASDGTRCSQQLLITVVPANQAGSDGVALTLSRSRIDPEESVVVTLGVAAADRDALLLGGARDLPLVQRLRTHDSAVAREVTVSAAWAPTMFLRAVAWLPGRGFISSPQRELTIRPIHRLLRVAIACDPPEPRPGSRVQLTVVVTNWKQQPVPGAHLSLGAIDERLYRLQDDTTPDLWTYFHDHRLTWDVGSGVAEDAASYRVIFFRSVCRWWPNAVMGIGAGGGGSGRYGARSGGGRRACGFTCIASAQPEPGTVAAWFGDVVTDDTGRCQLNVDLPALPGRWRLTARANDASAALLVGEVREYLSASAPLHTTLELPASVAVEEHFPAALLLHQRRNEHVTLTLHSAAGDDTLTMAAGARTRRDLVLPAPAGAGAWILRDGVIGRLGSSQVIVDDRVVAGTVFVRGPGLPLTQRILAVAASDGTVALPVATGAGDLVAVAVRAWASPAGKADDWVTSHATSDPSCAALHWLRAAPGRERSTQLAQAWSKLGDSVGSAAVRVYAAEHGALAEVSLPNDVPNTRGTLAWLRARLWLQGLAERPDVSGDALAAAAVQRLLGGDRAGSGWDEALRDASMRSDMLGLAIAADTARRLADPEAAAIAAELAACDWEGAAPDVVAVVLTALLDQTSAPAAAVTITGATEPVTLADHAWAHWCGQLSGPLVVHAAPGTVLAAELTVQREWPADARESRLWQVEAETAWPVPAAQSLAVQAPVVLELPSGESALVLLPACLMADAARHVTTADQVNEARPMPTALAQLDFRETSADHLREVLSAAWAGPCPGQWCRSGRAIEVAAPGTGPLGSVLRVNLDWHQPTWISLRPRGLGAGKLTLLLDGKTALSMSVTVGAPHRLAPPAPPLPHPLAGSDLTGLNALELLAIFSTWRNHVQVEQQQAMLAALRPDSATTLRHWRLHPSVGDAGHWTTTRLSAWLVNPLAKRDLAACAQEIGADLAVPFGGAADLAWLEQIQAEVTRAQIAAWHALPPPVAAPQPVSLRRIASWLQAQGHLPAGDLDAWFWRQTTGEHQGLCTWVRWLHDECGITVVLDPTVPVAWQDQRIIMGDHLGADALFACGLLISAGQPARIAPLSGAWLSACDANVGERLTEQTLPLSVVASLLDQEAAARGLGRVSLVANDRGSLDITLDPARLSFENWLARVARQADLVVHRDAKGWELRAP